MKTQLSIPELCPVSLSVLFEDNHLIAINKPAGLPVQGDSTGDTHLLDLVSDYLAAKYNKPGKAFVGLIHRLDRPVSGVVLLARTSKALTRMNEQFRNKSTRKIYHALVSETPDKQAATLQHYLGKDSKTHRALTYNQPKAGAKEAILHYKVISKMGNHCLLEIELETGRFHQIRAQLSKTGLPILGDLKYGAGKPLPDRSIGLHARILEFEHPVTGEKIKLTAPYPNQNWWKP
jgi:23S rRNA pseudouridine1911/1915/1917 synthase